MPFADLKDGDSDAWNWLPLQIEHTTADRHLGARLITNGFDPSMKRQNVQWKARPFASISIIAAFHQSVSPATTSHCDLR